MVAERVRDGRRYREGINIGRETKRLYLDGSAFDLVTNRVWKSRITYFQSQQFERLAKDANLINQNIKQIIDETHNRITQIDTLKVGNSPLEDSFYNGSKWENNYNLESLLPVGSSGNSGWPIFLIKNHYKRKLPIMHYNNSIATFLWWSEFLKLKKKYFF